MRELTNVEKLVFGADAQIDPATDEPIQMGRGSKGNETVQHLAALAKAQAKVPAGDTIPTERQLEELLALFKDAGDDSAHAARVKKLVDVANDARAAVAGAETASRELDSKRLDHIRRMTAEKASLEAVLEGERNTFEAERKVRFADLDAREADLAKREAALAARSAELNERQAKLDRGLAAVREATR